MHFCGGGFFKKISFIASFAPHLRKISPALSVQQMGVMLLLQLTVGFQTVHVSHCDKKLIM